MYINKVYTRREFFNNFCSYQSRVYKVSHEDDDDDEKEEEEHLNGISLLRKLKEILCHFIAS